ncbi:antA/AntB antirepressor family protein [Arsenophonus nasoniae]|uniref:AntA/AntB antirepressor n=2 Tax=Arsenophonus nasoniae TaxID=638 RepID=A0A4V1BWP6_9GAMM|nr:antA/AntB antirepressor family protein [Arsenophonus nasoniae]QBY41945.1 AntA/AntB antirepressor [Arsenophonus nasoniae]QBY42923.1 AntA/AntB antirepressor [Arsenophonus nasoniae]WGM06149.1 antA/AntB antirepressor family protein [Arsenophonus nasoniae]WGM06980.1 antA/AntB antirepressor family protein [Arsenophonus nasoniae]WGM11111.1 antA/AntB antirepressor family protein [Arsenophonus nasoniae]
MSILINIETKNINDALIQTVNARDLHAFLESKQDFSTWIKKRISDYGFVENKDFIRFHKKMEANNATIIDYYISLDMAKELSMVERNEKGKQARQYFIECERQAKTATHVIPQTLPDALRLAAEMAEKVQHLSLVNKEQKTEIDCLKNLFQVGMTPVQFCKQLNGVNINQVNLFLESRHFLYDAEKDISKAHVWRVHSYARDTYLTESPFIMTNDYGQRQCYKIVLLKKGATWLYNQYFKGKLPMKKDWNGEFTHDKYSQVA